MEVMIYLITKDKNDYSLHFKRIKTRNSIKKFSYHVILSVFECHARHFLSFTSTRINKHNLKIYQLIQTPFAACGAADVHACQLQLTEHYLQDIT